MHQEQEQERERAFWSIPSGELLQELGSSTQQGLTSKEASNRLSIFGKNSITEAKKKTDLISLLASQFKSPIIIIFIFTSLLAYFLGETEDALIIISIVIISSLLSFWQEKGATGAVNKLLALVQIKSTVIRDAKAQDIPLEDIVPGDIIILNAGDSIPADCLNLESKDLFVNESTLTGESFPVEKSQKILLPEHAAIADRTNCLFMGTYVVSGTSTALVMKTGINTELGKISHHLKHKAPETEFERGVRRFGYFLTEITLMLVISILVINVYYGRSVLDSFLFSLALAIGLVPQLLPAIISVNLSHGARRMAEEKVIVKRLASIENLGSVNVLCSDKTGTITIGQVRLHAAVDFHGNNNQKVLLYSYLNAIYESGFTNPIDEAIKQYYNEVEKNSYSQLLSSSPIEQYSKLDEIPYDFIRKRLSILVLDNNDNSKKNRDRNTSILITKGALHNILEICSLVKLPDGKIVDITPTIKQNIIQKYEEFGNKGFRVLGVAYRNIVIGKLLPSSEILQHQNKNHNSYETSSCTDDKQESINNHYPLFPPYVTKGDENNMIFLGFIILFDPLKPGVIDSISNLKKLGISLKIVSGDNKHVASYVAQEIGLSNKQIITGSELNHINSDALTKLVNSIEIFAEIEPNQKERIILALRHSGNVVGYMGDGINDAPALHAADASISVDTATDLVKESADFVLLEKDLNVLAKGVLEGRRTFANTLKYVFMATSANFGNMFSMAGASLFLSFLPLLPKQILLMNLMTDIPEMTISTDNVDKEMIQKPRRWDIGFIRKFMMVFGLLSTVFDYVTFGTLLLLLNSTPDEFRTAWFMESIISASVVVLVIRTRRPFLKSKPSRYLLTSTLLIIAITTLIPISFLGKLFNLTTIPLVYLPIIAAIVLAYLLTAELVKRSFYRHIEF
ncbi:MAG: HAD-IC family P-type ATPase [Nitrososphaeraceae archaeon]